MVASPICFYLMAWSTSDRTVPLIIGSITLAGALGTHVGPLTWWITNQLPDVQTRNSAVGVAYNMASMINGMGPAIATQVTHVYVSFRWKNPDFLLKNPDSLLRKPDFRLKNLDFILKQGMFWVSAVTGSFAFV